MALSITRGDTMSLDIEITGVNGEPYELREGDTLTFTVKKTTKVGDRRLVRKVMTAETGCKLRLGEEDTSLDYGDYRYDVELRTADGDVCTVVKPDRLTITEEVTTSGI